MTAEPLAVLALTAAITLHAGLRRLPETSTHTRPALWAGGMAGIAVADWAIAHEDTTDTLRGRRAA